MMCKVLAKVEVMELGPGREAVYTVQTSALQCEGPEFKPRPVIK